MTAPGIAGDGLLANVIVCGNGKPGLDHLPAQIAAADAANREDSAEAIVTIGLAQRRLAGNQRHQPIARHVATRPALALGIGAGLVEFWGIHPQQADTVGAKMKTVAIADPGPARHRRLDRIQPLRQEGAGGQNQDRQYGAGTTAERTPLKEVR